MTTREGRCIGRVAQRAARYLHHRNAESQAVHDLEVYLAVEARNPAEGRADVAPAAEVISRFEGIVGD